MYIHFRHMVCLPIVVSSTYCIVFFFALCALCCQFNPASFASTKPNKWSYICVLGVSYICVLGVSYICVLGVSYICVVGVSYICVLGVSYICVLEVLYICVLGVSYICVLGINFDSVVWILELFWPKEKVQKAKQRYTQHTHI
jgi:hypothetical protein